MSYFETKGVALVTGSAGGIGQGAANALAAAGATAVAFADIDEDRVRKAAETSRQYTTDEHYCAKGWKVDVTDQASVDQVVKSVIAEFGRIDYLVNSAGVDVQQYVPVPDDDPTEYDRVMAINAKGTLTVSRAVAKIMAKQESKHFTTLSGSQRDLGRGQIVNVTSAMSLAAVPGKVAYAASKHAALGITRALALDLADKGIRVNCICPTWVDTPMFAGEQKKFPPVQKAMKAFIPLGRVAEVDEVGSSIVYLCSPASSYVNGQSLVLDSGFLAGPSAGLLQAVCA